MYTTSSTPMPATGSLQLIEAVTERLDGAPVSKWRRWSDEFKEKAVATALEPGVNVSALARRLGISPPQLFGWRAARHSVIAAAALRWRTRCGILGLIEQLP